MKCTAARRAEEVPVASCTAELTVVTDFDALDDGNSDSGTSMDVLSEESSPSDALAPSVEEPAMLLRGPQDATALVGDRVLLKAAYMGRPEPTVRWTRAVSVRECLIASFGYCLFLDGKDMCARMFRR